MTEPASPPRTLVAKLTYKVEQRGYGRIGDAVLPLAVTLDGFTGIVEAHSAAFTPSREFESVDDARAVLELQLDAWRTWVRLTLGDDLMAFAFASAARKVPPPEPDGHYVLVLDSAALTLTAFPPELILTHGQIPGPPAAFRYDGLVEVGVALYADAQSIPRHRGKFGYAFLSMIEDLYVDQLGASRALNIDRYVLADFKDLCTRGGEGAELRKAADPEPLEMTSARAEWLMRVFRELIQRYGQVLAGAALAHFAEDCPGPDADFPQRAMRPARAPRP